MICCRSGDWAWKRQLTAVHF